MRKMSCCLAVISFAALAAPLSAVADTYHTANFTFGIFGGNANQQSPFQGVVAPYPSGGAFTGSLVYDDNQVPGAGSGYVNVFFSGFPDIAQIPSATALNLPLGALPAFTLGDAQVQFGFQEAAIQYNNGNFNGLFYISDFTYGGNPYELQIQGGSLAIYALVDGFPTGSSLANGYIDFSLYNATPYTPPPPPPPGVPEPAAWATMLLGLGLAGAGLRRRRSGASPAF